MAFHDVEFPLQFSTGSNLGPSWLTTVQTTAGGTRYASGQRTKPANVYAVNPKALSSADITTFIEFYNARRGSLHSFKVSDPYDCSTHSDRRTAPTTADGLVNLGSGDGSTTTYQLKTVYTSGGYSTERTISLPDSSTVIVQVNGVTQTVTTDYTVNSLTGQIEFVTAPPSGHAVDAGCKFYVPVYFGLDLDRKLAFEGQRALARLTAVPMLELPDGLPVVDIGYTMGATDWTASTLTAGTVFDVSNGSTQVWLNTSGSSVPVNLPTKTSLALGAELRIANDSSSTFGLTVRDPDTATNLGSVSAGATSFCILTLDSGGAREWVVVT